jgi:hypothetical protein
VKILLLCLAACGYRPVHQADGARLHVTLVRSVVADAVAADEVASGVRDELAKEGALDSGSGYPRVEIEVLRLDEVSEGIAAPAPRARASRVGVVARAWIAVEPGKPVRETGDMRATEVMAVDEGPVSSSFHFDAAVRAAARRLGQKLARKLLGHPAVSED